MFRILLQFRCQRILCIIFGVQGFVLTSQDLYDKVRYTVSWLHFPSTVCRDKSFVCNLPDSGRLVTRPNQGLSTGGKEKLGMRLRYMHKIHIFSQTQSQTKLLENVFPLMRTIILQQNYFQSNWFAEPNPLPPGQSCFLQTSKDLGCFRTHNNITSKGRGEGKNRYSYDF